MIRKIVSSGRTGVELAGLDVADKLGLSHGGWAPRGMRNDEGPLPERFALQEVPVMGFKHAMEQNIMNSDGTLLITRGHKSAETRHAVESALRHQRQLLHVDLSQHSSFEAASLISSWVSLQKIKVLFITGPSAAQDPDIYVQVKKILETAFYLEFVKTGLHPNIPPAERMAEPAASGDLPRSVEEAIERLKEALPLKDRTIMANLQPDEVDHLKAGLGDYIKQNFGLYTGNTALLESCAQHGHLNQPLPDEACAVILRALWKDLQSTHKLRIIKG
jgi:Circularly permutated YpsA SLOG family/Domain of unknown function (DUF6794)